MTNGGQNGFRNRRLAWYLARGTLFGGGFGALLGFLLVLFVSGMGDGGGDPAEMIADDVRGLIPYVAGWAMIGFVIGLVWWLIGRMRQRPYS